MTDTTDLTIYEDETPSSLTRWADAPTQAWKLADALMAMHPAAKEVGVEGLRTVAQLALLTGANPLPGTNGIHIWRDKNGKICHAFGMGFWRAQADLAGGLLWIIRPRLMTPDEAKAHGIPNGQTAAICSAALRRDVFSLRAEARRFGDELSFEDAKKEVARVGIGVLVGNEYAKAGRPPSWSALQRAERDLLRQLAPIGTARQEKPVYYDWSPTAFVDDPDRPKFTGNFTGDANYDLGFTSKPVIVQEQEPDDEPETEPVEEPEEGVIEEAEEAEEPADDGPLPDDEQLVSEAPAAQFVNVTASILETDAETVKERMIALGYRGTPRDTPRRLDAYRRLKADIGPNVQEELFGETAAAVTNGAYEE